MNTYLLITAEGEGFVIPGADAGQQNEPQAQTQAPANEPAGLFSGNFFAIGIIIVVWVAVMFFTTRSSQKKEKAVKDMQSALKPGDDVYTSGGFYGKIVDVEPQRFIVEFGTNKGVRVPVRKTEVFLSKFNAEEK